MTRPKDQETIPLKRELVNPRFSRGGMACHRTTQRTTRLGQEAEGDGNVVKRLY